MPLVFQVVSRSPVRAKRREAAAGARRAGHLPGQRVAVQTWRLCPVGPHQREEQNRRKEGLPHQDHVSGALLVRVCAFQCVTICVWDMEGEAFMKLEVVLVSVLF